MAPLLFLSDCDFVWARSSHGKIKITCKKDNDEVQVDMERFSSIATSNPTPEQKRINDEADLKKKKKLCDDAGAVFVEKDPAKAP